MTGLVPAERPAKVASDPSLKSRQNPHSGISARYLSSLGQTRRGDRIGGSWYLSLTMKSLIFLLTLALSLLPVAALAQVSFHIDIGGPPAQPPPVVEVEPGVTVVEGAPEEVYFSGGWYWCRRGDGWYRSRSPRAEFRWVDRRYVPGPIARVPPDRYRNWRRADHPEWHERGWERHEERGDRGRPEGWDHERGHDRDAMREVRHDQRGPVTQQRGVVRPVPQRGVQPSRAQPAQRPPVHEGHAQGDQHDHR